MKREKNINRVLGGKRSVAKNKWIQHVSKCRKIRSESLKRGLMTCARTYKRSKFREFQRGIALGAFDRGSLV